jgi:tetratricopeptide (TPR) repeat protein
LTPASLRDRRLVSSLLVLATLLVCLPAIVSASFHFDDTHCIVGNPAVRDLANLPRFFADAQLFSGEPGNVMYRPVMMATFAIDHALWGYTAAGWLLTNALIHAAVVVLTYRLALRLGLSPLAALFAGAVFALHPAISEVQNYASSRSESLAALFVLAALHAYLSARSADGGRRVAWLAATAVLGGVAMMAKETAAFLFAAVGLLELLLGRDPPGRRIGRAAVAAGVVFAAFAAELLLRREMLGVAVAHLNFATVAPGTDAQYGGGRTVIANLLTQSRVVVLYFKMLFVPTGLNVDHDVAIVDSVTPMVGVAIAVHLSVVAFAVREALRGARLFPLCVGWFYVFLWPSVVIPLNVVMNEHRMYLPMIAVALLTGACLARVAESLAAQHGSAARALAVTAVPFACFVALFAQRSFEWRDDETLWRIAVERAPNSARAHMNLGAAWHEQAQDIYDREPRVAMLDSALAEYAISEKLHATRADLWVDIGNAWFTRGQTLHRREDFEKALAAYDRFGELVGMDAPRTRLLRAAALTELGDPDGALALVNAVKTEAKDDSPLYDSNIAHILRRKGDKAGAAAALERVIARQEPLDEVDALLDLGWWYFEDGVAEARAGGLAAAEPTFATAEGYLTRALTISKRTHDKRPPLYVARFLNLLRQPGADEFVRMAMSPQYRWTAPPHEMDWIKGGATPGFFSGGTGPTRR